MEQVGIAGVGMVRFGFYPDRHVNELARDAALAALDDAGLGFDDIDAVYVGHIFMSPLVSVRAVKELGCTGVPIQRVESASATGSATLREAYLMVAAGIYDKVLVIGLDKMTEAMGQRSATPELEDSILPAAFFAMWATRRMHERGTKPEHLAKIAAKNWNNGALNPMSQRQPKVPVTVEAVLKAGMVAWPMTKMMACPVGDGAAAAVVCRLDTARKLSGGRPVVRIAASHQGSEKYERGHLFMGPVVGPARMSRDAADDIWEQSGLGPKDVDLVQVHDAFAIEELEYYELLGFCAEGEAEASIDRGDFERGGRVPFSTDGGLIARGHPGGPTGLAQVWETVHQLRGTAEKRQVENARVGLCHMMGGGSVCLAHLLVRD